MEDLNITGPAAKLIFDGVTDHAIIRTDKEGKICDWNAGAENVLGYQKEEIVGKNISTIFTSEDRVEGEDKKEMDTALKNGKSEDKRWHLKKNGIRFFGNGILNPLRDERNRLLGYVKILRDETAKHESERILRETQETLQMALESANMGLWSIDLRTNEVTASPTLSKMFDIHQRERDIFNRLDKIVHPDDLERAKHAWETSIKYGTPYSDQHRIVHSDGSVHWIMSRGSVKTDENGTPIIFSGVAVEITHLKDIEMSLKETEDRFNAATMSSNIGVWEYNIETDRAWRSLSHDYLHGYKDVVKEWSLDIALKHIHPEDKEKFKSTMYDAIEKNKEWNIEYRVIWPDRSVHWMMAKGKIITNKNGKPVKIIGTNIDITKRKTAELELEKTVKELQMERELRERFVATLSHDLRTPLTAAKIGAQIVSRKVANEPELLKTTHKIANNMDRADKMIKDLLDASYISAGQPLILKYENINLTSLFHDLLEEMATIHGDKFILKADAQLEGSWDFDGIKRVFENLISNAIKYGAKNKQIRIFLKDMSNNVEIEIHNEGPPIDPEEMPYLFEQYRRAKTAKSGEQKGWGIGLTLVKGFIDAHKGRISVQSTVETGTTFTIILPKKPD